ncbi:MAG: TonB-dependent receptor [Candidatus Acidiferrales bacterium]
MSLGVAWLLAAGLTAQAAEISGHVLDPQGLVLVGAHVRLFEQGKDEHAPLVAKMLTDAEGRFRFTDVPAGRYRLEVFANGFRRDSREIELGDESLKLDVSLAVAGVLEGVAVTATREEGETFDSPLPTAVLSSATLNRQVPLNLAQALEAVPGVTWVNAGAFRSRPIIRGLDSNRVLVLVDGDRLNHGRTSTTESGLETSLMGFGQVEQVEVVRGPGSVLYGSDAFGGVLNIRTRQVEPGDGLRLGVRLRGEFFTANDGRRSETEVFASTRWLGVRVSGSAGAFEDYDSPLGPVFRTGVDESSALGEVRVYPAPHRSSFFKFLHRGAYNFGFPDTVADPQFLGLFPFSKLQKYSAGYQASYKSPAFSAVQLRLYYQDQTRDFSSTVRTPGFNLLTDTVTDVESLGAEFQASSLAARRHVLTYGITYYRDRNQDRRAQLLQLPGTPAPILLSQAPSVPNSSLSGLGLFLQDQLELTRRLRLTGGVRFDHFKLQALPTANFNPAAFGTIAENQQDNAVTGNLAASYTLTDGWQVTGQVARAFREPNLFDRYFVGRGPFGGFVAPAPDLDPETSAQFDLGTRVRRGPVRASVHYFLNNLSNLLVLAPSTFQGSPTFGGQPVFQNVNVAKSRIQGVESSAEFFFEGWRSQWTPFLTLAWQRGTNRTDEEPLPFIAPFVSQLGLRWQPTRLRAWSEYRVRVAKGTDRVPPGQLPVSGFTVHGWRWGYESVRGERGLGARLPAGVASVNFHFGLENVTDHLYRGLFELVPEPARSFRFGMELNLDSTAR